MHSGMRLFGVIGVARIFHPKRRQSATELRAAERNMALAFSVITPSFNQGRFIRANIESVLAQGRSDVEHIVVDGGSTDETVQILKEYSHLKWVSEKDRGQSDALNKGIAMAQGEWIVWINSDDYLLPDALNNFARFAQANPSVRFAYSNMVFVDENGADLSRRKVTYRPDNTTLYYWWRGGVGFGQPGSFFRRSLWTRYGPFDAALHYTMDYDFWLKMSQHVPFLYLDAYLAAYRLHGASKTLEGWRPFLLEKMRVARRYWDARGGWRKWAFRFLLPLVFSKKAVLEGLLAWDDGDRTRARTLWREAFRSQPLGFLLSRPCWCFLLQAILRRPYWNSLRRRMGVGK
jgi:glycosyltransferase involved in cell wall biosynthesis